VDVVDIADTEHRHRRRLFVATNNTDQMYNLPNAPIYPCADGRDTAFVAGGAPSGGLQSCKTSISYANYQYLSFD
jgi:hypothetical protein